MIDFLILNLSIFLFSLLVIVDLKVIQTPVSTLFGYWRGFKGLRQLPILLGFIFIGVLLYFITDSLFDFFVLFSFTLSIINHLVWIGVQKRSGWQVGLFAVILLILVFFLSTQAVEQSNQVLRNLFFMVAISWLSPLLKSFPQFTVRHFIVLSGVWMVYDILYVFSGRIWAADEYYAPVFTHSLAIVFGEATLGFADFLWLGLLFRFLQGASLRLNAAYTMVYANLILVFTLLRLGQWIVIPLLTLWVPLGVIFLALEHNLGLKRKRV